MHKTQRSELDSFNRITDFNTNHQADLITILEYAAEKVKFDQAVLGIKNAGIAQDVKGIDGDTTFAAKKAMVTTISKYCLRAGVIARSVQNNLLAKQLNCVENTILKANKTKSIEIATNLRNSLNNNLLILTNIKPVNIAEIDKVLAAYDKIKDAPTENQKIKKSNYTDQLPVLNQKASDALDNMYDLVYSYFLATKPELVHEMEISKQVVHTGVRHTSITFTCVNDKDSSTILQYTVTDQSNDEIYEADEDGIINLPQHRAGQFHFLIKAPLHTDKDLLVFIKQRINNQFSIRLQNGIQA